MSIPTKTKIILMQSIDPTPGEDYESVDESDLEADASSFETARKDKSGRRVQLGTPATLIFPGTAIPANVRQMAIEHLQSLKQADDSSIMAVAKGSVPIVKRISSAPPSAGIPGWVPVTAAALIFLGVTTAALARSTLFHNNRAGRSAATAAAVVQPVGVPVVDLPLAAPIVEPEPEPISIIVPSADLKPQPVAVAPAIAPPPAAAAPEPAVEAPKTSPKPAPRAAERRFVAPPSAPIALAARPARTAPTARTAPVASPPAAAPASREADELAKMQAAAKQQLGETLP